MAKTLVTDTDISLSSLHQQLLIKPAASNDSTTVVQIQNSAGTVVLNVDTTNNRVGIGTTTPGNKLSILDPSSTTNGQLRLGYSDTYYWDIGRENTVNGRFSFINKQNNTPSELVSILTSGNFGIGTTSPAYALDVSGVIRSSNGILNTNNTFEKVFSSAVNFPNGTANQAVDIRLGNLAIGGYIEVELNSTYANQPSYGKLTKLFAIGTNPNNAIYTNESRVSDALGTVPDNVAIGDISWDATNSVYKIPISHIVSTGNQYTIKVRMFSEAGLAKPVFDAMTVSSIYTLTALPRNYVNYNGNVGIGTTTPGYKLEVVGSSNTEIARVGDGTRSFGISTYTPNSGGVTFKNAGTGLISLTAANAVLIGTGYAGLGTGVAANTVAVEGNVGIGTTTPGNKLAIVGSGAAIRITGTNDTSAVYSQFNTSANTGLGYVGVEGNTAGSTLANTLAYATFISAGSSGSALQLGTPGGIRATILASGNVGIGTTTPVSKLDISDTSNANLPIVSIRNTSVNGYSPQLNFDTYGYSGTPAAMFSVLNVVASYAGAGGASVSFNTKLQPQSTAVTAMTILGGGNVGIGITSPTAKLQVAGGKILLDNAQAIQFKDSLGTARSVLQVDGGDNVYLDSTAAGGDMFFRASGVDKMTIKGTSGNVGIGTASPGSKLSVDGALALKAPTTVNAATYSMTSTDSSLIITTTNCTITLLSAATYTGRILYIKNITANSLTSNASNVVPLGSATAGTAILAATAGKFAMLQSDGTSWITMMSN